VQWFDSIIFRQFKEAFMIEEPLSTRVTKIGNQWHCRLYRFDEVYDEVACVDQRDIGYCFYHMFRWYSKMCGGPESPMAEASRHRQKNYKAYDKIIYKQ